MVCGTQPVGKERTIAGSAAGTCCREYAGQLQVLQEERVAMSKPRKRIPNRKWVLNLFIRLFWLKLNKNLYR